jgi:hypothetical protein
LRFAICPVIQKDDMGPSIALNPIGAQVPLA